MGKSKRKGRKGKKGKKGKGSKKKGKKKVKEVEPPPPPELNLFVSVRRKNLTLCLETHEEHTIQEMKIQVATILRQFPEDITLYAMLGNKMEEMQEKEKPKKEEGEKREDKSKSKGRSATDSRGRGRDKKRKAEKKPEDNMPKSMTIGAYGYNATTANIFKPGEIGLAFRGDDGEFEKLDITPYSEFPVIPEEIKMHLRNYVPPPPPPNKKGGRK